MLVHVPKINSPFSVVTYLGKGLTYGNITISISQPAESLGHNKITMTTCDLLASLIEDVDGFYHK